MAIVGRPNVGKSTLFNRITRSRDALVANLPGVTRDRQYGTCRIGERAAIVIDSGGFEPAARGGLTYAMARQARQAIAEADVVVLVVDVRAGLVAQDIEIAGELRRTARKVLVAANKGEGLSDAALSDFYSLGLGEPLLLSAAHGAGVSNLVETALALVPADGSRDRVDVPGETPPVRLAVAGRPNVGKSTLVNTLLGEERVIVFDQPGTTRDSIAVDFERSGRPYTLIDTAGLRRRGRVFEAIEKFSVTKTLQAIAGANVVVLVFDARQEISDQDAHIAGFIVDAGRALVVAVNKWDGLTADVRDGVRREIERQLPFLAFAHFHFISALKGTGIAALMRSVDAAHAAAFAKLSTPRLTRILRAAVEKQQPPRRGMSRPKMRYAHQGGQNPPVVIIHGSGLGAVPDTYRRYLIGQFRDAFALRGTPLKVEFRSSRNPYAPER